MTLTYLRPWEPSDLDPVFFCVFEIGEDMKVTVVEDGSKAVQDSGYYPEINID